MCIRDSFFLVFVFFAITFWDKNGNAGGDVCDLLPSRSERDEANDDDDENDDDFLAQQV